MLKKDTETKICRKLEHYKYILKEIVRNNFEKSFDKLLNNLGNFLI